MTDHDNDAKCPFCGEDVSLTTEWGWVDDATCTATLCCPDCRTLQEHAEDAVSVSNVPRRADESREDCERRAIGEVLHAGLPAA